MSNQKFGGNWTIEKLNIFSDYLNFYITALKDQKFGKIYIDAFAGTGQIEMRNNDDIIEGSVRLSLNAQNKFSKYIFIEKDKKKADELAAVVQNEYSEYKPIIDIKNQDSNIAIKELCDKIDWRYNRALLLLDPFATQVKWETLKLIASTKSIDVWYLFPIGAVQRLMTNNGIMPETWKRRLDAIFGDHGWETKFYIDDPQMDLFSSNDNKIKTINTDSLSKYICERLTTTFPAVAPNPRVLYNSKNSPMFLFCFAVSSDNVKAQRLALNGAEFILKK